MNLNALVWALNVWALEKDFLRVSPLTRQRKIANIPKVWPRRKMGTTQSQKMCYQMGGKGEATKVQHCLRGLYGKVTGWWGRMCPHRGAWCDAFTESRALARSQGQEKFGKEQRGEGHGHAWEGTPHRTESREGLTDPSIWAEVRQVASCTETDKKPIWALFFFFAARSENMGRE